MFTATVVGRDVVPNVPDHFGGIDVRAVGADTAQGQRSKPDHSSFARRDEKKWDAEYSVPPGDGACSQCDLKQSRPSEKNLG